MNRNDREEIFKAINAVSHKVNDMSQILDEVMQRLNADANEKIDIHSGTLSTITEDILPTMQDNTSGLSDLIDQILTSVIPDIIEGESFDETETTE